MRSSKSFFVMVASTACALYLSSGHFANAFTHAVAVTVDEDDTPFVLDSSGSVWGYLKPDQILEPVKLSNLLHIKQIVPFAALTQDGHVFTWDYNGPACPVESHSGGGNDEGGGAPMPRAVTYSVPREVQGLDNVISIAGMARHFLALRRDGRVVEFGRKLSILPSVLDPCTALLSTSLMLKPVVIESVFDAVSVATDGISDNILERDGFFYGWGRILLDKNWRQESRDSNWTNREKIFVGNDKISISTNGYLVALSRNKKAYYWGICVNGSLPYGANILAGDTDNITNISKIILSTNFGYPNADILSDGKIVVLYPPDRTPWLGSCIESVKSDRAEPEFVSQISVGIIDAALPIGLSMGNDGLLMVGSDGSLWDIQILAIGGFSNLTNINLP